MTTFTHAETGTPARVWRSHPAWRRVPTLDLFSARTGPTRVVVVAAHPDDESLGAGGLVATAADAGLRVDIVALTSGEHSHPDSPTHDPARLARRRRAELHAAGTALAPDAHVVELGLEDGHVADDEEQVVRRLVELVGDGRDTLLVAPWRRDGHPDHEAAGRAAAAAAFRTGATLLEYPVWFWHWASPGDAPWDRLQRLVLSPARQARKAQAIAAHRTQVRPLSSAPGDEVLLGPDLLAHFDDTDETFVVEAPEDLSLDALHEDGQDPWGADSRWYEERKRDLVAAVLPRRSFVRGVEVGCSRGTLARRLAERCSTLVAVDRSRHAVEAARQALADLPDVSVQRLDVPDEWPSGIFDLVVVSEVGYFLSPRNLDRLLQEVRRTLSPDGVVVLCHWLGPVDGWVLDGHEVHRRFRDAGLGRVRAAYRESRFEILAFGAASAWPESTE